MDTRGIINYMNYSKSKGNFIFDMTNKDVINFMKRKPDHSDGDNKYSLEIEYNKEFCRDFVFLLWELRFE